MRIQRNQDQMLVYSRILQESFHFVVDLQYSPDPLVVLIAS